MSNSPTSGPIRPAHHQDSLSAMNRSPSIIRLSCALPAMGSHHIPILNNRVIDCILHSTNFNMPPVSRTLLPNVEFNGGAALPDNGPFLTKSLQRGKYSPGGVLSVLYKVLSVLYKPMTRKYHAPTRKQIKEFL
jgi:hypothetical protein